MKRLIFILIIWGFSKNGFSQFDINSVLHPQTQEEIRQLKKSGYNIRKTFHYNPDRGKKQVLDVVEQFNNDGRIIQLTDFYENGKTERTVSFEYDEGGKVTFYADSAFGPKNFTRLKIIYGTDGTIRNFDGSSFNGSAIWYPSLNVFRIKQNKGQTHEFVFDENGKVIAQNDMNQAERDSLVYEYSKNGKLIKITGQTTGTNGKLSGKETTVYTYNKKGKPELMTFCFDLKDENGDFVSGIERTEYKYKNGKVKRIIQYYLSPKRPITMVKFFYNNNGLPKLKREFIYGLNGTKKFVYVQEWVFAYLHL